MLTLFPEASVKLFCSFSLGYNNICRMALQSFRVMPRRRFPTSTCRVRAVALVLVRTGAPFFVTSVEPLDLALEVLCERGSEFVVALLLPLGTGGTALAFALEALRVRGTEAPFFTALRVRGVSILRMRV